jgi:hypothetical protein
MIDAIRNTPLVVPPSLELGRASMADDHDVALEPSTGLGLSAPIETPPEVKLVTQMLLASGSSDPVEALMGVLHQIRAISGQRAELDLKGAEQSKEVARLNHEKAIEDAKAAAEKRMKGAPKWVKKLVSVIVTAVGVAAAAFTGGTSLGLAIAGAVLLLGAEGIAKLGSKLGMSDKACQWMKLGIQVAGAALMLGAGLAGGAAATMPKALNVTQKTVKVVKAAMDAVEHSIGIVDAGRAEKQDLAECESGVAALGVEAADQEHEAIMQMLAAELARMQREAESISTMSEVNRETAQSVLDQLVGGPR